jgi:hypothetical protein
MSLPTLQEPVSWRIKLKWDVVIGLIGTIVEFHDRIQQPSAFDMLSFGKDSVAVVAVAFMICSHYPVNGHLIVLYITCIFVIFWQVAKGYGVVVSDTVLFAEFHLFTVLFFVAKLVLDSVVGITGSRLV